MSVAGGSSGAGRAGSGVFDDIKHFGSSTQVFTIPASRSIMFSAMLEASTPGTASGHGP